MKIYNPGKKILLYRLNPIIKKIPNKGTVVDIGCGTGDLVRYLANYYKRLNFIGIEVHGPTLNYAKQYKQGNTRYLNSDGRKLPLRDGSVDLIYASEVIEHVDDDIIFLKEVHKALKKNSLFIFTTPNKEIVPLKGANPDHKRHYSLKELENLLNSEGFHIIGVDYIWPFISRRINLFLTSLRDKLFKPVKFQFGVTGLSAQKRENHTTRLAIFLLDNFVDPILTQIILIDFKLMGRKGKYGMLVICSKNEKNN